MLAWKETIFLNGSADTSTSAEFFNLKQKKTNFSNFFIKISKSKYLKKYVAIF